MRKNMKAAAVPDRSGWATLLVVLVSLSLSLVACSRSQTPTSAATQTSHVGTWRWISVDGRPVQTTMYVRYFPDGRAATWPAPEGWPTTTNGVSYGRYHVEGEFLVLETGRGTRDPKARIEIKGNEMTLINNESNRIIYRRLIPDLAPGMTPK